MNLMEPRHPEPSEAESKDPVALRFQIARDLIRSIPVRSACRLPIRVEACPVAPFSISLVNDEPSQCFFRRSCLRISDTITP